ncbi:PAP2-domain-containing protein, partial [Fragilariopsis cylindrus CCMP1102]
FNPYKRRIPYQLSSSGEYVLNQMYNLKEPDNETVSPLLMFFCALVLPFCFQLLIICRNKRKYYHRYHQHQHHQQQQQQNDDDDDDDDDDNDIHKTLCVYLMSIGVTQSLTNIAKLYCGYLRPIFYEMCQPNQDSYEQQSCEGNQERQSRLSFPSGHASFSVCGLLVFSYYLERVYGISNSCYNMNKNNNNNNNSSNNNTTTTTTSSRRRRHHLPIQLVRIVSIVCYTPMLLAFFICISRVHDNFHHPADIIGGALLGGSIATVVFNTWY